MKKTVVAAAGAALVLLAVTACEKQPSVIETSPASPFRLSASISEIMDAIVDPSADALWDAVGTTVNAKGTTQRQPRTAAQWQQARRHAVALIEATNLLVMDGRKVVPPGTVADQNTQGVLSAQDAQKRLDSLHAQFVQFAYALHDVGDQMLKAIDARDPAAMMDVGATMDEVCEACHLTFWYPEQATPQQPGK